MKKNSIFVCMVVLPLMLAACAKNNLLENEEPRERATMIDPWTAIDQTPYMKMQKGEGVPLVAGAEQTKSSMTVDEGHSVATVSWSNGDSFTMYGWNTTIYKSALYTTSEDGNKVTFTSEHQLPPSPQHCLFAPGSTPIQLGHDDEGCFFGIEIPDEQTAVAGKVKDEYLYSYARTTFTTDPGYGIDLDNDHNATFHSMLAYVRFRMKGAVVPSVHSVTLRGSSAIAGNCVVIPTSGGIPQISFSKDFEEDVSSNTVTLIGTFAVGEYYYFAVAPGTQISLSIVFSDGSSHTTTKISSNSVTFARGQITDIGEFDLGSSFSDPTGEPSMATIKYMSATTTSPTNPVTIAVIPDGFTSSEMYKYELLAKSAINTLFNVEPFKSYKEYFNVYILKVASNESGASVTDGHGNIEEEHDCYFGSKWGPGYNDMEANETIIRTFVTNNCPDIGTGTGKHPIEEVPILMIINDSRYGGICHTSSNGFGYCMAPYTYEGGRMTWSYPSVEVTSDSNPEATVEPTTASRKIEVGQNSGNWLNTMVHEFGGHCFSRLLDEYWYSTDKGSVEAIPEHSYDVPMGLNISAKYGHDNVGWKHLLDGVNAKTSLVEKNSLYNRIGIYQGGHVSTRNRWRSERVSCMIDNRFYFSTYQRELIVRRIMSLAGVSLTDEAFYTMFWAKDVPIDPVRDVVSSSVMGNSDPVVPRPVPMLPPPRIVIND